MRFTDGPCCVVQLGEKDTLITTYHLDMAAARLARLRADRDTAEAEFEAQQAHLLGLLAALKQKSVTTPGYKITKRFSERLVVNEVGLKKALGAVKFNKLTDRKLNRAKLNAAVAAGEIDPVLVAQHTEIRDTSAWISVIENHGDQE